VKAFIIGNGLSRESFDLEELRGKGTIFGCNALYRDFTPDYLVSIDNEIISEVEGAIERGEFDRDRFIVPPFNEQFEPKEFNPYQPRSNAGMNAMLEAIKMGAKEVYCMGFDFLIDDEISVANIYDSTPCYGPETRANRRDNVNRAAYMEYVALQNRDVLFTFIFPRTDEPLRLLTVSCDNVQGMFYDVFEEKVLC
jgi:hypothetical protein